MNSGMVFQFKRYSIHDGPGIRTTVFLKGCPLSCTWCHNPESCSIEPQLALFPSRCIGCFTCVDVCPEDAVDPVNPVLTDREKCALCGMCAESCPSAAREIIGGMMSSSEVIDIVERDLPFYTESDGGVTFSGGEPLLQFSFLVELLRICRSRGIHSAVDTSCHAPGDEFMQVAELSDLMLCDIKLVDETDMMHYAGVSGKLILENIRLLAEKEMNFKLRLPVIPRITDTDKNLNGILEFIDSLPFRPEIVLLPYHDAWIEKCSRLGMDCSHSIAEYSCSGIESAVDFFTGAGVTVGSER